MSYWDSQTGNWLKPKSIWDVDLEVSESFPEGYLSLLGGNYYIGISFHLSPFSFPQGKGKLDRNLAFHPSDFKLNRVQDFYNSWGVNARLNTSSISEPLDYWNWLPGITIFDTSKKFTLPNSELSAFAGTEWADNDSRIFHGLSDEEHRDTLIQKCIDGVNRITGPRYSGWPFGYRQLSEAVFIWIHDQTREIHCMLLASSRQHGDKFIFFNRKLYDPGSHLGAWDKKPEAWECRQVINYLYKARLLALDGFHEIALLAAISAIETSFYEIVLYLEKNNASKTKKLIKSHTFLSRAENLIAGYGFVLPQKLFSGLKFAYRARNSIAHESKAHNRNDTFASIYCIESIAEWYYTNVK